MNTMSTDAGDTWEQAQDELAQAGRSDGLPLVPPTPERIERMLAMRGFRPEAVVARLMPAFAEATWGNIAENAVMAGCRPEYLPVIGAAIEALAAEEFNLLGIQTTTGSAAPVVIVNGPVVAAIGMNAAGNALGPGNRANATIGRAVRLILQNVGGATPGVGDMATLGQPGKYTFCFAENEVASPWPALHVERGYAADTSVVTVVGVAGNVEIVDSSSASAEDVIHTYANSMLIAGTISMSGYIGGGEPLIVMPPEHAVFLANAGYTKEKVKAALFAAVQYPLERLSPYVRERLIASRRSTNAADIEGPVRLAATAKDVMIVVAGGVGIKAAYLPTWSGGTRAVSRKIPGSRTDIRRG
jgi:hypothetical protein